MKEVLNIWKQSLKQKDKSFLPLPLRQASQQLKIMEREISNGHAILRRQMQSKPTDPNNPSPKRF